MDAGKLGPAGGAPRVDAQRLEDEKRAAREAARGLESVLVRQMLAAMEKAQLEDGLFGQSAGAGARQTVFQVLLSESLAEGEPLGLAEQIAEQLTRGRDPLRSLREMERSLPTALDLALEAGEAPFEKMRTGTQVVPRTAEEEHGPSRAPRPDERDEEEAER